MANIIDYYVDVLASSPEEINRIATRLKEPSSELLDWVAGRWQQERSECAENVRQLVAFEPKHNLFCQHESVNKARRFHNSFKRWTGIVDSHLFKVSKEFPDALFLLEYRDDQMSYSGKQVIHRGEIIRAIHDRNHHAQAIDWALLDIFAPFTAEYELGLPFGTLWDEWLDDITAEVDELRAADERWWLSLHSKVKTEDDADEDQSCPAPLDLTFRDDVPASIPMPSRPKHLIVRELRNGSWRTLCNLCHQPIPVTTLQSVYAAEVPTGTAQCFEVVPFNVGVYQPEGEKPREHVERWRKQPDKVVVCADCWSRL